MIPKKYELLVFSFFMVLLNSGIISLVLSIVHLGFESHTLYVWLKSWGLGFVVAYPMVIVLSPLVRKLVDRMIDD